MGDSVTGTILQHMNHTEDLILHGEKACKYVYKTLEDVVHILKKEKADSKVTVKLDGAPAVIASSDYHGKCFVGTKYAFKANTAELRAEKLAFSEDQLSNVSENEVVQRKLRALLKVLPFIDIPKNEIWGGDYLFSNDDLKLRSIEGEECICFHPNTIVYAVSTSDPLSDKLKRSDFGVAWHTKYKGPDFSNLKVNFDVDISQIQQVPNVFQMDANLPLDRSNLSEEEIKYTTMTLQLIKGDLQKLISSDFYSKLAEDSQYIQYLNTYRNALIRANNQEPNAEGFFNWLGSKYDKLIDSKKTPKAKEDWKAKKEAILSLYKEDEINMLYDIQNSIRSLKEFFIQKLDQSANLKTYLKYDDNRYEKANAEGYAVSDLEGNVQKLVSRLDFSRANFSANVVKGWTSEKRENEMALRESEEDVKESTIDIIKNTFNLTDKKAPHFTRYRTTYVLQPSDGESRELKAERVSRFLPYAEFYYSGTTPIIDFEEKGASVRIVFKPKRSGAIDTKGDEIYWAYCMAATINGKEELLPTTEEDVADFDMSFLDPNPSVKPKPSNFIGYTEGSKLLCNNYLLPGHSYLFFRENTCINLIDSQTYESIHSLIDEGIKYVEHTGFTSKDVWNPSDIVACDVDSYNEFKTEWEEALANSPSFEDLNSILLKYLKEGTVVGISLKDVAFTPHVEEVNVDKKISQNSDTFTIEEIDYPPLMTREEASLIYPRSMKTGAAIKYTRESEEGISYVTTQYRIFGGTVMQLESLESGHNAKLGKTSKFVLNDLLLRYGIRGNRELSFYESADIMNENPESMFLKIKAIEESNLPFKTFGKPLTVNNFEEFLRDLKTKNSEDINTYIWPRVIDFLYLLTEANEEGELEDVIKEIYKGAKKEFDWCAPFIKIY